MSVPEMVYRKHRWSVVSGFDTSDCLRCPASLATSVSFLRCVTEVYIPVTGSSDLGGVLVVVQLTKHSVLDVLVVRQSETVAGVIIGTATSLLTGTVITGEVQAGGAQGGIHTMDTIAEGCGVVWLYVTAAASAVDPWVGAGVGLIGVFMCDNLSSGNNSSGGSTGHSNAVTP